MGWFLPLAAGMQHLQWVTIYLGIFHEVESPLKRQRISE